MEMNNVWVPGDTGVRVLGCRQNGKRHYRRIFSGETGEMLNLGAGVELELPAGYHGIDLEIEQSPYVAILLDVHQEDEDEEPYAVVMWLGSSREFDREQPHFWVWRDGDAKDAVSTNIPLRFIKRGVGITADGAAIAADGTVHGETL